METPRLGAGALEGRASILVDEGEADRAARLLGAAEAIRARLGTPREPTWATYCDRTAAAARTALGEVTFAAAHEAGRRLDFAAACAAAGAAQWPEG